MILLISSGLISAHEVTCYMLCLSCAFQFDSVSVFSEYLNEFPNLLPFLFPEVVPKGSIHIQYIGFRNLMYSQIKNEAE
jgi:hypothetical protein